MSDPSNPNDWQQVPGTPPDAASQGYPPPAQGYPPPQAAYPPPDAGYPPPPTGYPPQQPPPQSAHHMFRLPDSVAAHLLPHLHPGHHLPRHRALQADPADQVPCPTVHRASMSAVIVFYDRPFDPSRASRFTSCHSLPYSASPLPVIRLVFFSHMGHFASSRQARANGSNCPSLATSP